MNIFKMDKEWTRERKNSDWDRRKGQRKIFNQLIICWFTVSGVIGTHVKIPKITPTAAVLLKWHQRHCDTCTVSLWKTNGQMCYGQEKKTYLVLKNIERSCWELFEAKINLLCWDEVEHIWSKSNLTATVNVLSPQWTYRGGSSGWILVRFYWRKCHYWLCL